MLNHLTGSLNRRRLYFTRSVLTSKEQALQLPIPRIRPGRRIFYGEGSNWVQTALIKTRLRGPRIHLLHIFKYFFTLWRANDRSFWQLSLLKASWVFKLFIAWKHRWFNSAQNSRNFNWTSWDQIYSKINWNCGRVLAISGKNKNTIKIKSIGINKKF